MRIVRREVSGGRWLVNVFLSFTIMLAMIIFTSVPSGIVISLFLLCVVDFLSDDTTMRCLERGPDADTIKKSNLDYIVGYEVGYAKGKNSQYMLDKSATGQAVLPTSPKE